MSLRGLFRAWNEFFFKPQSPIPVCLFRIFYGVLAFLNLVMLHGEWLKWYGPHAFISLDTMHRFSLSPHMSVFEIIPQTDVAVNIFYWAFLVCTVFLTFGFMSRFSAFAVYLFLGSIQMRNEFILNSGDTLMLVTGFFLVFSPCGAALSVDRWLRLRRGRASATIPLCSPWAQRMLQIQTSVVYFATFYWKSMGVMWINGTAIYYALHLQDFQRFPVPIHSLWVLKSLTWLTLFVEFALGVLIWFKELRYPVLLAGLCLHLGIEYAMNIPLFEWMIVATYINFVDPEDLSRTWNWLQGQSTKWREKFTQLFAIGQARNSVSTVAHITDEHV